MLPGRGTAAGEAYAPLGHALCYLLLDDLQHDVNSACTQEAKVTRQRAGAAPASSLLLCTRTAVGVIRVQSKQQASSVGQNNRRQECQTLEGQMFLGG